MTKCDIPRIAQEHLADLLQEPGGILNSSHETLRPGSVYLLGFNPGGSNGPPLRQSITAMLSHNKNAYLDESWSNGNGSWEPKKAPLQRRVLWLLEQLGLEPRQVCASNLIFLQSRGTKDVSYSLADKCWPVHEAIIEIVKPKMIIAFGNSDYSPYAFLRSMFGGMEETMPSGHGTWKLKGFQCRVSDRPTYVAGLPHLSWYKPEGKPGVVQWLSKHM